MQHLHRRVLDHAGDHDTDALTRGDIGMIMQKGLDARRERDDEVVRIPGRRKAHDTGERCPDQIREQHKCFAGAHVGGHDASAARVDVEERRTTAAKGFAGGAFDHQTVLQQVVDDERHRTAPDAHDSRQVRAGNRLMGPNQVQNDASVDLA